MSSRHHPPCSVMFIIVCLCALLLSTQSTSSVTSSVMRAAKNASCYVTQNGCKYRVSLTSIDCSVANDAPDSSSQNVVKRNPDKSSIPDEWTARYPSSSEDEHVDAASLKKIENLEQTLVRMIDGLSTRSLRHIRQIKTDLRHMSAAMNELKSPKTTIVSSAIPVLPSGKKSNSHGGDGGSGTFRCPAEFVGGGTWPSCYRFSAFNASWHEAREYCSAFGANLLSLDTLKEAYIVDYLIKTYAEYEECKGWWTSGNYIVRQQKWMWTSRHHLRPLSYSRWAPGEPNARSTMHCLLLYRPDKYFWHDATCTDKHWFICETEM